MERKNIFYLSLIIVGTVFAALTYVIDQDTEATLTILYITGAIALIVRLLVEWRYYYQHNAQKKCDGCCRPLMNNGLPFLP